MNTLKAENIGIHFKEHTILNGVSLELTSGNVYGIIGANGSGKSVLLQMLCGLLKPTQGSIRYNDKVLYKELEVVPECGIIINKPAFFNDLNGFKNLKLLADVNKKIKDKEILEVLDRVGLKNDHKKVGNYSVGMIQRLGIAQAIMEDPKVLILDEFTNGLDEDGIQMVHQIVKSEKEKNKLIIITSHNKYDIETLCDEVYRINGEKLVYEN